MQILTVKPLRPKLSGLLKVRHPIDATGFGIARFRPVRYGGNMIRFSFACLLCLCCVLGQTVNVSATQPVTFKYINNALGFADRQGFLSFWWHADGKIVIDPKTELQVRFLFNSNQRYVVDGCLGEGWWFPMLESTITQRDDDT